MASLVYTSAAASSIQHPALRALAAVLAYNDISVQDGFELACAGDTVLRKEAFVDAMVGTILVCVCVCGCSVLTQDAGVAVVAIQHRYVERPVQQH